MDEEGFWRIIGLLDWKQTGDDDAVLEPAVAELAARSEEDIVAFADLLAEKLYALDTQAIARAASENAASMQHPAFSDLFLYARCVVVANGRDYYQSILARPQRMPKDMEFEALLSLVALAYERRTSKPFEHVSPTSYETGANRAGWPRRS